MKTLTIIVLLFVGISVIGFSSTTKRVSGDDDTFTLTGTFIKEDGTPAVGVRINVFEIGENGKVGSYNAVISQTENGLEMIFQCPGTAVTDKDGKLVCTVDLDKFETDEKRFTLAAQYKDPLNPNSTKMPQLKVEKPDSTSRLKYENSDCNLDNIVGKITVMGI